MFLHGTNGQATDDDIIRRMCFACWITKATNTDSEYVTPFCFSMAKMVTRTRLNITFIRTSPVPFITARFAFSLYRKQICFVYKRWNVPYAVYLFWPRPVHATTKRFSVPTPHVALYCATVYTHDKQVLRNLLEFEFAVQEWAPTRREINWLTHFTWKYSEYGVIGIDRKATWNDDIKKCDSRISNYVKLRHPVTSTRHFGTGEATTLVAQAALTFTRALNCPSTAF